MVMEVLLRRFRKQKRVLGILPLEDSWLTAWRPSDGRVVLQTWSKDLSKLCLPVGCAGVVSALAQTQVLCHRIAMSENLSTHDRDALAYYQAEQYFANSADNLALDAVALGESIHSSAKQDVLLIAAHKTQVQEQALRYQTMGLALLGLDIYACAISRFFQDQQDALPLAFREGAAVLLDVASTHIGLYCFWRLAPVAFFECQQNTAFFPDFLQAKLEEIFGNVPVGLWHCSADDDHLAACLELAGVTYAPLPKVSFVDGVESIRPNIVHMVAYGCALYEMQTR